MSRRFGRLLLAALALAVMANVQAANVAYTDGSARQWRQITDTLGLTWFDVITVCDAGTGACAASTGGVDFAGWHWANVATVNELFHELSGGAGFNSPDPQEYEIMNSTWAPASIDNDGPGPDAGLFNITATFSGVEENVLGWTRDKDPDPATGAYLGRIVDTPTFDKLQTDDRSDIDDENPAIVGFWLYREVTPVPVPAGAWLLSSGLITLAGAVRRRRRARVAG